MFKVRFDFDLEEYKKHKKQYDKMRTKPYYFGSGGGQKQIEEACMLMAKLSSMVVRPAPLRDRLLERWFGKADKGMLTRHLTLLDNVIADPDRSVLFVDGRKRHVRVKVDRHNLDAPQELMATPYDDTKMDGAVAWVHALPGTGAPRQPGEYHVGSGIRVILGRAFDGYSSKLGRAGVVYHELSHKILGTNDHTYGELNCEVTAKTNSARAVKNADNYRCFLMDFHKEYYELGHRA